MFGPWFGPDHHIIGLLADAGGRLAAEPPHERSSGGAAPSRQLSGEDHGAAGQWRGALNDLLREDHSGLPELVDQRARAGVTDIAGHGLRDHRADLRNAHELLLIRFQEPVDRPELLRQDPRRLFAHMPDAQPIEQARQPPGTACADRLKEIVGFLLTEQREFKQLRLGQTIHVCRVADQAPLHHLLRHRFAQPLDVHGLSAGEVQEGASELGRTGWIGAAGSDVRVFLFGDRSAACRTAGRGLDGFLRAGPPARDDLDDLRDDLARPLNDHPIPCFQPQPLDLVIVMETGAGNGHAAAGHRVQFRHRRDRPGPPHGGRDRQDLRRRVVRGKLIGDGPARGFQRESQPLLLDQVIDLDHRPVDLIRQHVPAGLPLLAAANHLLDGAVDRRLLGDRQPQMPASLQEFPMRLEARAFHDSIGVDKKSQRTRGGDLRILLAQAPRGGVAGIGEGVAVLAAGGGIVAREGLEGHVDFAADLQQSGWGAPQPKGDRPDRLGVGRHILPGFPVAARGGLRQASPLIGQRDPDAVDLQFRGICGRGAAQSLARPLVPGQQRLGGVGVVQREHRNAVPDGPEDVRRHAADPLSGRVPGDQLRVAGFQRLQLLHERVILGIGGVGLVEDIIPVVMMAQLCAQVFDLPAGLAQLGIRGSRHHLPADRQPVGQ